MVDHVVFDLTPQNSAFVIEVGHGRTSSSAKPPVKGLLG
jgi:hypothetical protein